jgi:hypothetical protein
MNKKEIIIPFVAIGLVLAFVVVSLAVFTSNGKSKKWVARKMRIGALLLTLNAFTPGMAQEIEVTCYEPAPSIIMALQNNESSLSFGKNSDKKVKSYIENGIGKDYSFCLVDEKNNKIQTGTITALDGEFNSYKENFEVLLDKNLKHGRYYLLFYSSLINDQNLSVVFNRIQIDIKDE